MKKGVMLLAAGMAAMFGAGKAAAVTVVDDTVKKEIAPTSRRKSVVQKFNLEPTPPPDFNQVWPVHTSPIFSPTRSQRVKNKLNRKYYK